MTYKIKGSVTRDTLRTSLVLGLRLVVQAGTLLLVARMLGAGQFGVFAGIAALAVLLGSLSTFGTHLVLLGEMSKKPQRRASVLVYAIPCTLLCGAGLLLIYGLICIKLFGIENMPVGVLLLIGITELLLQPLLALMVGEHHALGRIARSQLLQLLPMALRLTAAGLLLLLQTSQPLVNYTIGYLTASILALGVGALTLEAAWPSWRTWRRPTQSERIEALGYAASSITRVGPAELDKTLALHLLPHGAAGVYAAGARVIGGVFLPVTAMILAALPRLFRDANNTKGERLLVWMLGSALVYSVFLATLLWLSAPLFIYVFGADYDGINEVIQMLCLAVPGLALRLITGNALIAMGKPWLRAGFEVAGILMLTISAILLTAKIGATGIPLALVCAEWTMALIGVTLTLHGRVLRSL